MSIAQIHDWVKSNEIDIMIEKFTKLWKEQIDRNHTDADHTRQKIKCNHIIFTKLSKQTFSYLMRTSASLVFRDKNALLYMDNIAVSKVFFIVLYGSFTLMNKNGKEPFGELCTNGFTIGEEVLFEPTLTNRFEIAKATQPSCCLRIDLEKFRNMSNVSLGGNIRFK